MSSELTQEEYQRFQDLVHAGNAKAIRDYLECHPYRMTLLNPPEELSKVDWSLGPNVVHNFPISITVLERTANRGNVEILNLLIDFGADVNHGSAGWGGPLCSAVQDGNEIKIVRTLIKRGAKVDGIPGSGHATPLCQACWWTGEYRLLTSPNDADNYFRQVATVLLQSGANPNGDGRPGSSALFPAITGVPDPSLIQELINYGASPFARNRQGQTPLDCAKEKLKYNHYPPFEQEVIDVIEAAELNAND